MKMWCGLGIIKNAIKDLEHLSSMFEGNRIAINWEEIPSVDTKIALVWVLKLLVCAVFWHQNWLQMWFRHQHQHWCASIWQFWHMLKSSFLGCQKPGQYPCSARPIAMIYHHEKHNDGTVCNTSRKWWYNGITLYWRSKWYCVYDKHVGPKFVREFGTRAPKWAPHKPFWHPLWLPHAKVPDFSSISTLCRNAHTFQDSRISCISNPITSGQLIAH